MIFVTLKLYRNSKNKISIWLNLFIVAQLLGINIFLRPVPTFCAKFIFQILLFRITLL